MACTKLVNWKIPARTECPYREQCDEKRCAHSGESHPVEFRCAIAEAFDMEAIIGCGNKCEDCGGSCSTI